ncbi:MAG: hypothetical protein Q9225_007037 [Loekoesia sp. 1 TL-2023]
MADDPFEVKEDLCDYLEVIGSGQFATSGLLPDASSPGLFVHGLGKVGLPLSDRDAADLARLSHEAPFGQGSETFIDTTVRKTWELNPHQFELRNPAWQKTVQKAVGKVADELGVIGGASSIRPELHKLLLYDPGAFFDKHRDTEKAQGMFSTLVIALPSEHTGGDVNVQLRTENCTLQTQGRCDFDYVYLVWYADVNHSISKISSGHRLVLTYNLILETPNSGHIPSVVDDHKQNLDRVLTLWDKADRETGSGVDPNTSWKKLVYILEHEYSEANICVDQLKGRDQSRIRYLSEACRDCGFCLFLAHFQFSQYGSVDEDEDDPYWAEGADIHEFIDELDSTWKLKTIFQPVGQKTAGDIELEEDEIINGPDFAEVEPADEECDGWTGNEGCTATHFYYRTCAVILPRARRLEFLSEAETLNVEFYVKSLLDEMQTQDLSVKSKDELKKLCEMVIEVKESPKKPRKESANSSLVQGALKMDDLEMAEAVVGSIGQSLPLHVLDDIGKQLAGHRANTSINCLEFSKRVMALEAFINAHKEASHINSTAVQDLSLQLADGLTEAQKGDVTVTADDAKKFVLLSEIYGDTFTFQKLFPLAKKNVGNLEFIFALMEELSKTSPISAETRKRFFRDIFNNVVLRIPKQCRATSDSERSNDNPKRRRLYYNDYCDGYKPSQRYKDSAPKAVNPDQLSALFHQCDILQLSEEADRLSDVIVKLAPNAKAKVFETLLLPLLHKIPPSSSPPSISQSSTRYANSYCTILSSYIQNHVQPSSVKLDSWQCLPRGCDNKCPNCIELDTFLTSPDRRTAGFSKTIAHRKHLEKQLSRSNCKTWTDKDRSPHTLVVEKTVEEQEEALKGWKQRCEVAKKAVEEIGFEKITNILGEGWEDTVGVRSLHGFMEGKDARQPLEQLAQGKAPAAAKARSDKTRQGADVVDLTL